MTAVDPSPVTAWATTTPTPNAVGKHRWSKGGPVDHLGRRIITDPVPATYWPDDVPPPVFAADTAVIDSAAVRALAAPPAWPGPESTGDVLAALRAELAHPDDTRTEQTP